MKEINYSFNGGMPLSQNVLAFSRDGIRDVLLALYQRGYNGTPVIVSGCVYDSVTNDVTAGWIYDGTEPLYFPGGNTVTAGTNLIKIAEATTTVVFESGANQPIYKTRQYAFDNTGVINITTLRKFGLTEGFTIPIDIAEAAGSLTIRINTNAGTMRLSGSFETLTATTLASDGLEVKLIDDADIKADIGAFYPSSPVQFLAAVMPEPGLSGVINDLNNNPVESIPLRLNNGGLFAYLRKTATDQYIAYLDHTFIMI